MTVIWYTVKRVCTAQIKQSVTSIKTNRTMVSTGAQPFSSASQPYREKNVSNSTILIWALQNVLIKFINY